MPPASSPNLTILIVILCLLAAILIFSMLKGVIKMLLLAIAAISAIAAWIFIQKNGFTLISLFINSPQPWMVQALAWLTAVFIFSVFFHGMNWFSQLFSWHRGGASTGGILTTILMCALMLWLATIGISYYGDVSLISYYHSRASADSPRSLPWSTRLRNALSSSPATSWILRFNPMDDPAQTKLACLVAYGCTLSETQMEQFYHTCLEHSGIPHPSRFLDLFRDQGLRTLVREKRFVNLLENSHLKTFLQFQNTQNFLEKLQLN